MQPTKPDFHVLVPCAGTGTRAQTREGGNLPKQYQPVVGWPLVRHTLKAFEAVKALKSVWVVVSPGDDFLSSTEHWTVVQQGGATRAATVANGLKALRESGAKNEDWVLVHDAARCLVTPEQIKALMAACENDEVGGLLALKLPDTLKQEHQGRVAATLERGDKWLAQTPQMFRLGVLAKALAQAGDKVTDEASAIEALGLKPLLVPGSAQNFKVTYPEDFVLAEAVLEARKKK
jgi:2-C-methyl-D-erythritol 4-phosphate cytidylyltransferase